MSTIDIRETLDERVDVIVYGNANYPNSSFVAINYKTSLEPLCITTEDNDMDLSIEDAKNLVLALQKAISLYTNYLHDTTQVSR